MVSSIIAFASCGSLGAISVVATDDESDLLDGDWISTGPSNKSVRRATSPRKARRRHTISPITSTISVHELSSEPEEDAVGSPLFSFGSTWTRSSTPRSLASGSLTSMGRSLTYGSLPSSCSLAQSFTSSASLSSTADETSELSLAFMLSMGKSFRDEVVSQPCQPFQRTGSYSSHLFSIDILQSEEYPAGQLIGKDIAHARFEAEFYEQLQAVRSGAEGERWAVFLESTLHCYGVKLLRCMDPAVGEDAVAARDLLVLERFGLGFDHLRLLDVKLGKQTAVAGWKGKRRWNAWRNDCIDMLTNSAREGFRVEGFEAQPKTLRRRVERFVEQQKGRNQYKYVKEASLAKFALQRLCARDFLAAWLDTSGLGPTAEARAHSALWGAVSRVGKLLEGIAQIPAPQKWIGSSVALGWDVGEPGGGGAQADAYVKVFDWGRAEVSTLEDHKALRRDERRQRVNHWKHYAQAAGRLQWELCRLALHRCCCPTWNAVVFELWTEPTLRSRARRRLVGVGVRVLRPPSTAKGDAVEVLLSGGDVEACSFSNVPSSSVFRARIALSSDDQGRISIVIDSMKVSLMPGEAGQLEAEQVLVLSAMAFECEADAQRHAVARRCGAEDLLPEGLCYCTLVARAWPRASACGSLVASWDESFELVGLGDAGAAAARAQLLRLLPGAATASFDVTSADVWCASGSSSWPRLLPPHLHSRKGTLGTRTSKLGQDGQVDVQSTRSNSSTGSRFSRVNSSGRLPWRQENCSEERDRRLADDFVALAVPWAPADAPVPKEW